MASQPAPPLPPRPYDAPLFDAATHAARWIAEYRARAIVGDVLGSDPAWAAMFEELASVTGEHLGHARERVQRHAADIGTGFRIIGEADERPWPLSPVPLLIEAQEWADIARGVVQRADLLETVIADLYGDGKLVDSGVIPAALVTGSPYYLRPMVGLDPPGGKHLHFIALDLGRGPTGEWRVLADHLRAPAGAGYALENRLAVSRTLGGLQARLNVQRHAPFFAAFREGIAALCRRSDPRIGLMTPGRFNPSYPEQAHLARYLGLLLVEGADLAALEDVLYVRTIAGLKRVDALWRRVDPRLLDPLAFDSHSQIGVPGLIDAYAAGNVVLSNAPGAAVMESRAFAAFLPRLAVRLLGESLHLPNIATWWCGQPSERDRVVEDLDTLLIAPAFGAVPLGLTESRAVAGADLSPGDRATLLADLARRPQDYVAQEIVRLSTMPVVIDDALVARPFTLRVFAARDADGAWTVMPGGFARIGDNPDPRAMVMGDGVFSADVCIHGGDAVEATSLLPATDSLHIRRNPGTLPSRVADNFYWLGRYLERGEALLAAIRVMLGHSIDADGGALAPATIGKLVGLIVGSGAAAHPASLRRADLAAFARSAMEDPATQSVLAINRNARDIADGSRDRLSADMVRLLDAPFPTHRGMLDRAGSLQRRYAAVAGLSAEHMVRTDAWRFHDLGRRIERAMALVRATRLFGMPGATADDLSTLLDLADSQISYRQRYPTGIARVPVVDLVALDPGNPRAIAYQTERLRERLGELPVLGDDGMAEAQQAGSVALAAILATATAAALDADTLGDIERRIGQISEALAHRYFLHGAEPLRAHGLTLA